MKIVRLDVAKLSNDPANARKHDERNIAAIVASLRRFGQQKPIVVDSTNVVRAGNGTLEAARVLGWDKIDAVVTDLSGSEATAYAIADNRTAELAAWDDAILAAELNGLATEDPELLAAAGFTDEELEGMLADGHGDPEQVDVKESFLVIVECADIERQQQLYERLTQEGLTCRLSGF